MHRIVIIAFDGVQSLDVSGPAEVFAGANQYFDALDAREPSHSRARYDVTVASLDGGVITTESAVRFDTDAVNSLPAGSIDTLIVPGGFEVWNLRNDTRWMSALRELIARCDRLITVCSGAALAAAAGALDGHRVATHWARANRLAEAHPDVTVDVEPIFIRSQLADSDGCHPDVWSSAGVTAGIDLCLAIVEHDHSADVAQEVARWLVMYLRRPGGQSQFAAPTWIRQAEDGPIRIAQELVIERPADDWRVAQLARRVALSERHFVRRFTDEVGVPPAKFVAAVRVDAARHELERSDDTVDAIARRCGFGTAETLRRTLVRHLGVSPDAYRRRFTHQPQPDPVLNPPPSRTQTPPPSPDRK